jgi:YggT family protein
MSCVLHYLLTIYLLILLARVLSSFFPVPPSGPIRSAVSVVYALTEPVLRPLQGLLPPVRMGPAAMDFSPIIVFIVLGILLNATHC